MNLTLFLENLGFRRQDDLGVNLEYAEKFFWFYGETYTFDERGICWTKRGIVDPGDYFGQVMDPMLWQAPFAA